MTYLLLMERWKLTFKELCATPQWVIDDMILVMEAEHQVDEEPDAKR
jgi:hypothetical protein